MNILYKNPHQLRARLPLCLATLIIIGLSGFYSTKTSANAISFQTVRDCNSGAVINCGALTTGQLQNAYYTDSYIQKVYSYEGINSSSISNLPSSAVAGSVSKNGSVYINGQAASVASNLIAVNRQDIPGSTEQSSSGIHFYESSASAVMNGNASDAFVVMNKHHFEYAIIASNGDPVVKKPVAVAAVVKKIVPVMAPVSQAASTALVNTGPGTNAIIGLFVASTTLAATLSYRRQLHRL